MRIVIDTNVLISAALSPDGAPAQLLQQVLTEHLLVFSSATFAEFESRLGRPRFDRYINLDERKALLHDLSASAMWVAIAPELAATRYSRDAADDMFVHAALAAGASLLITGDQDLLLLAKHLNDSYQLTVCKPAYALGLV